MGSIGGKILGSGGSSVGGAPSSDSRIAIMVTLLFRVQFSAFLRLKGVRFLET